MKSIDKIKYYISFVGWGRSGNSLVAALLDFHPNIYIKNEFVTWQKRFETQEQIFKAIIERRKFKTIDKGGRAQAWGGFQHSRFKDMEKGDVLVVGGKKGGGTSDVLINNPKLFEKFYDGIIKIPVKWVHIQRNPYDNITTFTKHNRKPDSAIDIYFLQAESVEKVLKERDCITVRLEDVVSNPKVEIKRLCEHLEVDTYHEYLKHCKNIVWESERKTRYTVNWWNEKRIKRVKREMKKYDFMNGYRYK
jgi:hypothetical protein